MKSVIAVPFSRKLSGKTNYRKRLGLLKASLPRLVVRKTLTGIILQVADFDPAGDRVRLTVTSKLLRKLGRVHSCKNIPASYLAGLLIGRMALDAKIKQAVPDIGMQAVTKGSKIFAAIKGAKDSGFEVPISEEISPSEEDIGGGRIARYANSVKQSGKGVQFSRAGDAALSIADDFKKVKAAIIGGNWKESTTQPPQAVQNDNRWVVGPSLGNNFAPEGRSMDPVKKLKGKEGKSHGNA